MKISATIEGMEVSIITNKPGAFSVIPPKMGPVFIKRFVDFIGNTGKYYPSEFDALIDFAKNIDAKISDTEEYTIPEGDRDVIY